MSIEMSSIDNGKNEHNKINSQDQDKIWIIPCDKVASRAITIDESHHLIIYIL